MEIYLPIVNYENDYMVSNHGNIKSIKRDELILKQATKKDGYKIVGLLKNGKRKMFRVNRIVYQTFKGDLIDGMVIDHDDNDKSNNHADNLNQITHRLNCTKDQKNKTSKYPGVCFETSRKLWRSVISFNNKDVFLGRFKSELDAKNAYEKALLNSI